MFILEISFSTDLSQRIAALFEVTDVCDQFERRVVVMSQILYRRAFSLLSTDPVGGLPVSAFERSGRYDENITDSFLLRCDDVHVPNIPRYPMGLPLR